MEETIDMEDYQENEQRWHQLMNSLRSPETCERFYWGKHIYENFNPKIGRMFIFDYCHLRIWKVNNLNFALFSQNSSDDCISMTLSTSYIATAVNHAKAFLPDSTRFFESYEHEVINGKPYFHEIRYNYDYSFSKKRSFLNHAKWSNATAEFINTLKL